MNVASAKLRILSWLAIASGFHGLTVLLTYSALPTNVATAQRQTVRDDAADSDVVARVGEVAITRRQVEAQLRRSFGRDGTDHPRRKELFQIALEQLIQRELAYAYLTRAGFAADPRAVERERERWKQRLEQAGQTWEAYVEREQLLDDEMAHELAWRLSWNRFLRQHMTDENLAKYFERYHRDFDGTQLHVAHILLPLDKDASDDEVVRAMKRARTVHEAIESGQLSFAAAARRYSQAPTAADGGDLGWIGRHDPMSEAFSRAAFLLEPGQISPPVRTGAGVHLIRCLEVRAGTRKWTDVREELQRAVADYLFDWAADQMRGRLEVRRADPSDTQSTKS